MPRTKEQNEAIRAEKKQLIMDTALKLFAENGFERTSIECIAQHAGISIGLMYKYFKSKDDLLYQILASGMQMITDFFHADMTMEELIAGIEKFFDYITENREFFKLYTIISVQPNVTKILELIRNENQSSRNDLKKLFDKLFGEQNAIHELILYSVIMKGFTVVYVFDDKQNEYLKNVIVEFIRNRYKSIK